MPKPIFKKQALVFHANCLSYFLMVFFLFFPENRYCHFMQTVFTIFPRKQAFTFYANCLLRRHFPCNVKAYFLRKIIKIFQKSCLLKCLPSIPSNKMHMIGNSWCMEKQIFGSHDLTVLYHNISLSNFSLDNQENIKTYNKPDSCADKEKLDLLSKHLVCEILGKTEWVIYISNIWISNWKVWTNHYHKTLL